MPDCHVIGYYLKMCPVSAYNIQTELLQSESLNVSLAWIQWFYLMINKSFLPKGQMLSIDH